MKLTHRQLKKLILEQVELSEEMEDKLLISFFHNGPHGLMLAQSLGAEEWIEDFEYILKKVKLMINTDMNKYPRGLYLTDKDSALNGGAMLLRSVGFELSYKQPTNADKEMAPELSEAYDEWFNGIWHGFGMWGFQQSEPHRKEWILDWIAGYE